MAFDWSWIGTVNAWQTVATIAVIIVALFVIARFLIRFWPWLKKVIALFDALAQLPTFITTTDLAVSRTDLAVSRVELGVKGIYERLDGVEGAIVIIQNPPEEKDS